MNSILPHRGERLSPQQKSTLGGAGVRKMRVERAFWVFLAAHVVVWSLLPILFHPNAPLDVVEAISWGREWQLGYYKHPALAFWLANLAYLACGGRLWGIFILSQLSIAAGIVAVWRIAREVLDEGRALAACVLLEGIIYYNFTSPEFNPNVLELAIWPWIVYFAWRTLGAEQQLPQVSAPKEGTRDLGHPRFWNWIGLGACAGVGLFTKYYTAVLLLSLMAFAITDREARRVWRQSGPYVAMLSAVAIFAPHAWWMLHTRMATVNYAMSRTAAHRTELTRLIAPLKFTGAQLLAVLPMLLALLVLYGRWRPGPEFRSSMRARLLSAAVLGPFCITLLLGAIFNWQLLSMWGTPLWSFLPLLLLWSGRYSPTFAEGTRRVFRVAVVLMLLLGVAFVFPLTAGPYLSHKPRKALFGGEPLGKEITQRWHEQEGTPLRVVAGDTWLAGNVAFYSPDRPSVLTEGNLRLSPWVSEDELRRHGAVVVWEGVQPPTYAQLFPGMKMQPPIRVAWHTRARVAQSPVYWAIVSPQR